MNWSISYYSDKLQQDILNLPRGMLSRYLRYVDLMMKHDPTLGMPHSRALGEGLFELRVKAVEGSARVFYCTLIGEKIVILHHFIKKSQKIPLKEIQLARTRMKEVL